MIYFVSSTIERDANHRLWFTSIPQALSDNSASKAYIHPHDLSEQLSKSNESSAKIIVMYKDMVALQCLISLFLQKQKRLIIGVIASDIYDLSIYQKWLAYASFFIAPSPEHAAILQSFSTKDIYVVEETIDPVIDQIKPCLQNKFDGWLSWIGYPESFNKGMTHLMPVIQSCVEQNYIKGLKIITTGINQKLPEWIKYTPYKTNDVASLLSESSLGILSHFQYDLHINSQIKTDNKALLFLALGIVPIVSNTPSYSRLYKTLGLDRFLFNGPKDLFHLIARISSAPVRLETNERHAIANLLDSRSPQSTAKKIENIFSLY
ncbi:hypothetical protein [Synechococcus elongatus]|uniref:Glycosyltransferase family 1 protein n=1 Tax=Synechococcus elongatus PCC 11802 TaxID=2283154 RepID=A0AAT9JQE8_SYNEL|nr:hypothetical protein [Synechococcus elongatus]QFZ92733.1 hypothetical protein EKO22_10675 [Synechococcus elongatus PCC 11802]